MNVSVVRDTLLERIALGKPVAPKVAEAVLKLDEFFRQIDKTMDEQARRSAAAVTFGGRMLTKADEDHLVETTRKARTTITSKCAEQYARELVKHTKDWSD